MGSGSRRFGSTYRMGAGEMLVYMYVPWWAERTKAAEEVEEVRGAEMVGDINPSGEWPCLGG